MSINIQKFFNGDLSASLARNPDVAKQIGAKFQFFITGEGGGEWFVDVSDSGPYCTGGAGKQYDIAITLSAQDFQKLYESPQASFMQLCFAGNIKTQGNRMLGMKLHKLFSL